MTTSKVGRRCLALMAATAVVLAGCGGPGASPSTQSGTGPVTEADIDPTAILRVSAAASIPLLDPVQQTTYGMSGYLALIYDRLTMLDKDDNLIPGLATRWEFAPDGSFLELTLRDDVTFHDGTPFDAAALRANIERGKTLETSTVRPMLADITEVEVVNSTTARLHLVPGTGAQLPSTFATMAGMMISPTALADSSVDLRRNPGNAGSGPFVVSEFLPNERLVLTKAPSYWDPQAGRLGGVELERIPDATTQLNGVQTGQTDLSFVSTPNSLAQAQALADSGQLNFHPVMYRSVLGIFLRANQGDLANPQVRQAIAHSIDPDAINALYSGRCTPYRQLYPEGSWPAIENYEYPYPYDPARARALVAAAGGAQVSISVGVGSNAEQPANVIQAGLAEAGIDARLNPVPNSEVEARFIAGDFEMYASTSFTPAIDPADTVDTYFLDRFKLAVDPAPIRAAAEQAGNPAMPQAERGSLYEGIWRTALQQAWFIPICHLTLAAVHTDDVLFADNIPWMNIGIWDLRNVAMRRN